MTGQEAAGQNFYLSPAIPPERMLANMRSSIARGLPQVTACRAHGRTLSVAGGGPSLADTRERLGDVIATMNGSLRYLLGQPKDGANYLCGIMDAGEHIADMIVADPQVRYYVASICDPSVFDKLRGCDVRLWHVSPDSTEDPKGVAAVLDTAYPDKWHAICGGCTMGLRWINLGYFFGFRRFELHGLDSSFRETATHAYPDRADAKEWREFRGRMTRPNFLAQVYDFFETVDMFNRPEFEDIQIAMLGDGLLQDMWQEHLGDETNRTHERDSEIPQSEARLAQTGLRGDWRERRKAVGVASGIQAGPGNNGRTDSAGRSDPFRQGGAESTSLIACIKTGDKYGPEYVTRLRDGIRRHLKNPHRFVCYTDNPVEGIDCEPLPANLPVWWAKLGLFRIGRPLLYFDLDVVITGDLSPLLDWEGFGAIKDWWQPGINSSVMKLSGAEKHVWDNFKPEMMARYPGGDQQYIGEQFSPNLKTFPPDYFPSYKANRCVAGPPEGAKAVIFHGRPKPHECGGWVADLWTNSSNEVELETA